MFRRWRGNKDQILKISISWEQKKTYIKFYQHIVVIFQDCCEIIFCANKNIRGRRRIRFLQLKEPTDKRSNNEKEKNGFHSLCSWWVWWLRCESCWILLDKSEWQRCKWQNLLQNFFIFVKSYLLLWRSVSFQQWVTCMMDIWV